MRQRYWPFHRTARALGRWVLAVVCGLGLSGLAQEDAIARPGAAANGSPSRTPGHEGLGTQQADFGMVLKAQGGSFRNIAATVTVPADWPNQQRVRVVREDLPRGATVNDKRIDDDVGRQLEVKIPWLAAEDEVRAVITFEVELLAPPPLPQDPGQLTIPDRRKLDRKVKRHLDPSPKIESGHPQVRQAAEEAVGERAGAWDQVQAIHAWVFTNIQFAGGFENVQTCMQTLERRRGVCAEKNSLAVAMLRASGFPARLIRIPGHCYYEVYLLDGDGKGHWVGGDASTLPQITPRGVAEGMILQKGDNVSVIDPQTGKRTTGRFLAETATGMPQSQAARLLLQPISPALTAAPRTPAAANPGRQ